MSINPLYYLIFNCILLTYWKTPLSAQSTDYKIQYPHNSSVDAFGFDSLGYPWSIDIEQEKLEVIKYNGQQSLKSNFPIPLKGNYSGQVIFIGEKLLIGHTHTLYLFDPSDETYEIIWELPDNFKYNYSFKDDLGVIYVLVTHETTQLRQIYRYTSQREFELAYDIPQSHNSHDLHYTYGVHDIEGKLYFTYEDNGLLIIDDKGKSEELELIDQRDFEEEYSCSIFRLDNKNGLWRIYKDKIEFLNRNSRKFELHPLSSLIDFYNPCLSKSKYMVLNSIFRDGKNRLWIAGEDSHLYMYEEETNQLTFFGKELVDNLGGQSGDIISLAEDKSGNIWGRKRGGIFKITESKSLFEKYAVDTQNEYHSIYKNEPHIQNIIKKYGEFGIRSTAVSVIQEDSDGNILFCDQRFVFKLDTKKNEVKILPIETKSSNVHLFVGDGLNLLSTWNQTYTLDDNYEIDNNIFSFKRLENILQQKNGDLWISGFRDEDYNILFAKVNSSNLQYTGEYADDQGNTLSNEGLIRFMTEDDQGNLWLTKYDGIFKIDANSGLISSADTTASYKGELISIHNNIGLKINHINDDLFGIRLSNAIALLNVKTNELEEYITANELGISRIEATYIDKNSAWFSHDKKISNYNFTNKEIVSFSNVDGIDVGDKVFTFKPLSTGKIAVGTSNGLYIFQPDSIISEYKSIIKNKVSTPLRLDWYSTLDGKTDSVNTTNYFTSNNVEPIELGHNDKMLNLQFSLLNFDNPRGHQYSHWLEGYDKDWSVPIASNTIQYTSLPAGDYNLKVRANTGNGIWSSEILEIPITINQAWYRSLWFYLLALLGLSTIAMYVTRHYYKLEKAKIRQEQEQAEALRLKELDELKGRLFTNITHEFRTPLTVIMGMVDNIKNHPKEKNLIQRNSKNLLRLVNQLLDLSKAEAKNLNINNIQSDIISYLRYLTESFYSMATDKGIRLTFYSEESEVIMDFDEIKIQHVLYNLLSNAIKFTNEDGKVIVHISKALVDTQEHLKIKIQDNGIGIPAEVIPHLFDRFYQADNSSTRKGEGTGIGLTLTNELIRLMDGKIEVISTPKNENSKGKNGLTEFTIWLPITNTAPLNIHSIEVHQSSELNTVESVQQGAAVTIESTIYDDPTLLMIEDNVDIILYLESILSQDYKIISAKNGQQGIDRALEIIPDIIISDVMMPVKDGYEVCHTLKNDHRTSHIPIILLTAKAGEEAKIEGLKQGADAYLTKPFNKAELMIRLEKLISLRKQVQNSLSGHAIDQSSNSHIEVIKTEEPFLTKINSIIEEHIEDSEFGVSQLAKSADMSTTQIYRKLKALTGNAPSIYIRKQRLLRGKKLLRDSDLTVAEIAYSVGFSDPNYFSRTFHKEFGKPPSSYRN